MLEIKNIAKSFKAVKVLDDCSLTVEKGAIFGLVGVNGAGKSTLLRLIAGVYAADKGEICFNSRNVYTDELVREEILLIGDEIYYEKNATINSLKRFYQSFYHFDEGRYQSYLKLFALDPTKQLSQFSKGMKRQASLLSALAIQPQLLLLDEAFDGLDPLVRLNFKKALTELIAERKITVIISSHNLKELEDICDTFGLLAGGKLKTSGDLAIAKEGINKYQVVYNQNYGEADFKDLGLLSYERSGRVITLVVKGERSKVEARLKQAEPLLLDVLPVNFEELFIYEVESRGKIDE